MDVVVLNIIGLLHEGNVSITQQTSCVFIPPSSPNADKFYYNYVLRHPACSYNMKSIHIEPSERSSDHSADVPTIFLLLSIDKD
jgi:hypothetical protein